MNRTKRGFTLIELLVVIAIIALLMGLLLPALNGAMKTARTKKDQAQVRRIYEAFLSFAVDNRGDLPKPSHINRGAVQDEGGGGADPGYSGQIPGIGPAMYQYNSTGPLYSSQIAQNYFTPEICISPVEVNPLVREMGDSKYAGITDGDIPYNYDAYNVDNDQYWDGEFSGDIRGFGGSPCHVSYSHLTLCGERVRRRWNDEADNSDLMISNRGTASSGDGPIDNSLGGDYSGEEYTKSPTLLFHGPDKQWEGVGVAGDASTHYLKNYFPDFVVYEPRNGFGMTQDNIFAAEFLDSPHPGLGHDEQESADVWMSMSYFAHPDGNKVLAAWDPLRDN